jgi:pilus assembly protein CpaC
MVECPRLRRFLCLSLLWLASAGLAAAPEPVLEVQSGWSATVFVRGVSRIEVGDPRVAAAGIKGRGNIQVRGLAPGQTTLAVWAEGAEPYVYEIRVQPAQPAAAFPPDAGPDRARIDEAPREVFRERASAGPAEAPPPMAPRPGDATLDLFVGSASVQDIGEAERIVVGNDAVIEASMLDDGSLLVLGKSQGAAELRVLTVDGRRHDYSVRVYPAPPGDSLTLIRAALAAFPDVVAQTKLGRVILTGTVDAASFERFTALTERFPGVLSTVTPQLNIAIEPSVVLDVSVLEINRNYQRTVGVRWQDTAPGPAVGIVGNLVPNNRFGAVSDFGDLKEDLQDLLGLVGSGTQKLSGYLGITSIIGSELQLLQEEGQARVLAAPSLSTVSGEEATFLAGGDFPVAVLNEFGQPVVEFREFGVKLTIQPFVDRQFNVRSKVSAEVSAVDFSVQVNGVPGLLRRKTTSTITARPGETVILSGLLDARDTRNADKVPGLGNVPIIGQLFRSDDFMKQRTELVVTVTPRIQQPNTPLSAEQRAAERYLRKDLLTGSAGLDQGLMK